MKNTAIVCAIGAALMIATAAHADTVKGTSTFTDTTNTNTLTVTGFPNPNSFTESVANNGISTTDNSFFVIFENIPGNSNSTQTDNLSVSFNITDPGTGVGNQGGSGVEDQTKINGNFSFATGSITWDAPAVINLSDGQTLYIDLGDISLANVPYLCGTDLCGQESATFTLTPTPAAAPEPGSLALLGTSILGGAGVLRRRFKFKA